ncbi:MAG: SMC-Scp complex subunit ScpB [Actinomycetaceae bacterium]|nr:SMC-Scp complex subunit ScpB [Actinomycetaceae bacterium]
MSEKDGQETQLQWHSESQLRSHLEAILMVVDAPARVEDLAQTFQLEEGYLQQLLQTMSRQYEEEGRGFQLREIAQGWRFYSHPDSADAVKAFIAGNHTQKLTQAALETLAVIAYRQPITRQQISAIRGVNVDSVLRGLVVRGLVEEVGQTATGAGLYQTTTEFLERMGLRSLEELAPLAPFLPKADELDEIAKLVEEA